jgi:hypothetical protein
VQVACVVPLYPPSSRVGAWLATHAYLSHLATQGHQVNVWRYLTRGDTYELDGVTVHSRPYGHIDADVFVGHLGDDGSAFRAAAGRPLVQMVHGWVKDLDSRLCGDLIVCNSHATARWIPAESIVCEPITDPAVHTVTPGDAVTLVNLADKKGGALFNLIARSMPDVQFLGVRGSYGRQVIRHNPNMTVEDHVLDMRDVWRRTRVLLMPSERETWGMAGVEAMCSGIPVVAHPTDGLVESLGDAGIFVDRRDFAGWRAAIERLNDPDEWAAASDVALTRAMQLATDIPTRCERFTEAVESLVAVKA